MDKTTLVIVQSSDSKTGLESQMRSSPKTKIWLTSCSSFKSKYCQRQNRLILDQAECNKTLRAMQIHQRLTEIMQSRVPLYFQQQLVEGVEIQVLTTILG